MKKLLIVLGLALSIVGAHAQSIISTNVALGKSSIVTTNTGRFYQLTLLSTAASPGVLNFYDTTFTNSLSSPYFGTNYVLASNPYRASSNYTVASSYVDTSGNTNWYTNSGIYTYTATNSASTNQLPKLGSFVTLPNLAATYDIDWTVTRGLSIANETNVQVILYYRPN
jgi:hypothetical protein